MKYLTVLNGKKGIVKNKKDEAKYWKKIALYLCAS